MSPFEQIGTEVPDNVGHMLPSGKGGSRQSQGGNARGCRFGASETAVLLTERGFGFVAEAPESALVNFSELEGL